MKSFDIAKIRRSQVIDQGKVKPKPKVNWYYFYRSLRIVLTFWIITVGIILVGPWADYWIKSMINHRNDSQILGENAPTAPSSSPTPVGGKALFYLKNSKVEIRAPIIEGIGEDSLVKGIGHHPDSVWPNQKGNVVLAGHNTDLNPENPYSRVFFKLRDVSIGDQVIINFEGQNFIYKVFKTQTVKPNDTSFFGKADDWILTFYTCDPPFTDWKRLVYQAKLEKIE